MHGILLWWVEREKICRIRGGSGHAVERVKDFGPPPLVIRDLASLGGFKRAQQNPPTLEGDLISGL